MDNACNACKSPGRRCNGELRLGHFLLVSILIANKILGWQRARRVTGWSNISPSILIQPFHTFVALWQNSRKLENYIMKFVMSNWLNRVILNHSQFTVVLLVGIIILRISQCSLASNARFVISEIIFNLSSWERFDDGRINFCRIWKVRAHGTSLLRRRNVARRDETMHRPHRECSSAVMNSLKRSSARAWIKRCSLYPPRILSLPGHVPSRTERMIIRAHLLIACCTEPSLPSFRVRREKRSVRRHFAKDRLQSRIRRIFLEKFESRRLGGNYMEIQVPYWSIPRMLFNIICQSNWRTTSWNNWSLTMNSSRLDR